MLNNSKEAQIFTMTDIYKMGILKLWDLIKEQGVIYVSVRGKAPIKLEIGKLG